MVAMWSKWVEAFPTNRKDASAVTKALLTEIIPRWGISKRLSSDNGSHFVNQAIHQLSNYLGIDLRNHCAYHPGSGGAVDRENGTLKNKLAKICADTKLTWTQALPLALIYMRMRKRTRTGLSSLTLMRSMCGWFIKSQQLIILHLSKAIALPWWDQCVDDS